MSKYVVFDGMDGSGKGTQVKLLQDMFSDGVVFVREPGGTPFAEEIRKLVRDNPLAGDSTPLNNLLLFFAAREDLVHHVVVPSLAAGKHVFSDRGYSSTFAYQLEGEQQHDLYEPFALLREWMFERNGRRKPDLHIVYDLPADVARERVFADVTRKETNHFDERPLEYYERVREGFRIFSRDRENVVFVDATQSPEAMHAETLAHLKELGIE